MQEFALAVGGGGNDGSCPELPRCLDHFESGLVEQIGRARAVVDQHRLAAAQCSLAQHLSRRRSARLAHEAEMISRRCAVKGQRATFCQKLKAARKRRFAGVAHDIVGQLSVVQSLIVIDQWPARGLPRQRLFSWFRNDSVKSGKARILAIDRADRPLLPGDELCAVGR